MSEMDRKPNETVVGEWSTDQDPGRQNEQTVLPRRLAEGDETDPRSIAGARAIEEMVRTGDVKLE